MSFWNAKEARRLFQILPFYNVLIEKTRAKHLKSIDLFHELPFYDKLRVAKISEVFTSCARTYKIEIIDTKKIL